MVEDSQALSEQRGELGLLGVVAEGSARSSVESGVALEVVVVAVGLLGSLLGTALQAVTGQDQVCPLPRSRVMDDAVLGLSPLAESGDDGLGDATSSTEKHDLAVGRADTLGVSLTPTDRALSLLDGGQLAIEGYQMGLRHQLGVVVGILDPGETVGPKNPAESELVSIHVEELGLDGRTIIGHWGETKNSTEGWLGMLMHSEVTYGEDGETCVVRRGIS